MNRTLQIMLTTFKLSLLLMIVGFSLYVLFSVLGISSAHYRYVLPPSHEERVHPLKHALKINTTYDAHKITDAFHNIHYDLDDLYI